MKVFLFVCLLSGWISAQGESFQTFKENGKVGIKDQDGKIILPASFEALGWSDGSFSVIGTVTGYRQNNHWGLLNLKKEFITQAEFENLVYGGGEYVVARKKINPAQRKTGCLNLRGEIQIPFLYDDLQIHGLRAIVINLSNGRYQFGLTDLRNKSIIPATYSRITPLGTLRYAVQNEAGKIALYAEDGRAVTPFHIDSIAPFRHDKAIFFVNTNQGVLDREGQIIAEATYPDIRITRDTIFVLPHNRWTVLDENNKTRQTIFAEDILFTTSEKNIFQHAGYFGFIDQKWQVTLPAQYEQLTPIYRGLFLAKKHNKSGIITSDNQPVIPFRYDSIVIDYPRVRTRSQQGWALTDITHSFVSEKSYTRLEAFQNGLFPAKSDSYWGALTTTGEETIHCVFDSLLEVSANQVVVKFKGQYGIISHREEWLVAPQQHFLKLVNDSCYLQVEPANQFLKSYGGTIIYFTDNKITLADDYFTEYLPDGTIKLLNYNGRLLTRREPPQVDKVEAVFEEHEGLRGVKRDGKYGFIDTRGRLRIANRYDGIGHFSEGLAAIKLIGRWGFVNTNDQIVVNPNYTTVQPYQMGLSVVTRNSKTGVIDTQGKFILNLEYDSIQRKADTFRLFKNNLVGLADKHGKILLDPRFTQLEILSNGMVKVSHAEKTGVVTAEGLSVIPMIYDALYYFPETNQYLALERAAWKTLPIRQ